MQALNQVAPPGVDGHHLSKTVIVIPAYNEERFIGSAVLKAHQYASTIVVVDDGSTDKTAEIAREAGAIVVRHEQNQGKGGALNTGFRHARQYQAAVTVAIDADGQHVHEEIGAVMAPVLRGEADIVIGSRYLIEKSDVPQHRVWGHRVFNFLTNRASGVCVTDSQSGFRAFSRQALEVISFSSSGFSVESEMQFIARDHNLSLVEVPITIRYHDKPKRSVITHGLMVLNGLLQLVGQYRPLLFFCVPGFLLSLMGVGWGVWVIDIFQRTQMLAVGYALISVMLFIVGNIILSTGIILHSVRGLLLNLFRSRV